MFRFVFNGGKCTQSKSISRSFSSLLSFLSSTFSILLALFSRFVPSAHRIDCSGREHWRNRPFYRGCSLMSMSLTPTEGFIVSFFFTTAPQALEKSSVFCREGYGIALEGTIISVLRVVARLFTRGTARAGSRISLGSVFSRYAVIPGLERSFLAPNSSDFRNNCTRLDKGIVIRSRLLSSRERYC